MGRTSFSEPARVTTRTTFVCPKEQWSLMKMKIVCKRTNMSSELLYNAAVYKNTTLILKLLKMT